jgi:hypothetical protein
MMSLLEMPHVVQRLTGDSVNGDLIPETSIMPAIDDGRWGWIIGRMMISGGN